MSKSESPKENLPPEDLPPETSDSTPIFRLSAKGRTSKALGLPEWSAGLIAVSFWGTAFYFVAEALEDMHPGTVAWLRITLGFIFFSLLPIPRPKHSLEPKQWIALAALGVLFIGLPFSLFAIAQQWIDSSLAGMLIGFQPILTTALASIFLKTLPTKRNGVGLCFGLAGIILTAWPSLTNNDSTTLGVILVFVAVSGYALATNLIIPMTQQWGSYFVTLRVLFFASIFTMPYGIFGLFQTDHTFSAYLFIAILGVGPTALAPFLFSVLTAQVGATRGSSVTFLVPLIALYMGSFIRNEDIESLSLIGLGIILCGIAIMGGVDDRH